MATYVGSVYADTYRGGAKTQYGLDGNDYLSPAYNNKGYELYGGNGNDQLLAFDYNDFLYGGQGNDLIDGYGGNDYIEGGAGADRIYGEAGRDTLTGGVGPDVFYFSTPRNPTTNVDTITDFMPAADTIGIENAYFAETGPNGSTMHPQRLFIGATATTPTQRIGYDPATGYLIYDSNGSEAGGAQVFAVLDKGLNITNADFLIT